MDPDATYTILTDTDLPLAERAEAAEALLAWLARGGFPPADAHSDLATRTARQVLRSHRAELARKVTDQDRDQVLATYLDARELAVHFHSGMGDPLYALSSSGALVYAGRATIQDNLTDDADDVADDLDSGDLDGNDELARAADAFADLARWITSALAVAEAELAEDGRDQLEDEAWTVALGEEAAVYLRAAGLPLAEAPQVEHGWTGGPRWVLPHE